jgi:hypothetical protein
LIENESTTSDLVTVVVTDLILDEESVILGLEGAFWGFGLIFTVVVLVSAIATTSSIDSTKIESTINSFDDE